jgi:hypothetical protein
MKQNLNSEADLRQGIHDHENNDAQNKASLNKLRVDNNKCKLPYKLNGNLRE